MQFNSDRKLYWEQKAIKKKTKDTDLDRFQMENGALKGSLLQCKE